MGIIYLAFQPHIHQNDYSCLNGQITSTCLPSNSFFLKKAVTISNYDLINIAGENKYHSFQKSTTMNAWPRFNNKNVWLSLWIIYCNKYLIPIGLIVLIIKHLKLGQTPNVEDSRVWRSINSVIEFSKSIGYQSQRLQ